MAFFLFQIDLLQYLTQETEHYVQKILTSPLNKGHSLFYG